MSRAGDRSTAHRAGHGGAGSLRNEDEAPTSGSTLSDSPPALVDACQAFGATDKDWYCYFNNDAEAAAACDALELQELPDALPAAPSS